VTNVFVLKVALKNRKGVWRRIAVRGNQTLTTLHGAIFHAFGRYDDHLFSFYFSKNPRSKSRLRLEHAAEYGCAQSDTDSRADDTRIDSLGLRPGSVFEYLFDYGDETWHEITLEATHPEEIGVSYPAIVASKGRPRSPDDL
jgi:hypothetical protein